MGGRTEIVITMWMTVARNMQGNDEERNKVRKKERKKENLN